MSDWRAQRADLLAAAQAGDVEDVRGKLTSLLSEERSPRVFALGAKLADSLSGSSELEPVNILLLRSYTVEPMLGALSSFALCRGLSVKVDLGDYGQFEQVLLGADREIVPDVVLMLARLTDLEPRLADGFVELSVAEAAELVASATTRPTQWLSAVRKNWKAATPLLAGVSPPSWPELGLADSSVELGQRRAIEDVNEGLRRVVREHAGAVFLDIDSVVCEVGRDNAFDRRMWAHARQPYAVAAIAKLAERTARTIAARFTTRRKCIILDCDNTLWGGIVGEDGPDGIALGPEYPGSAFLAFQRQLLAAHRRGIILAIASKNNEADVFEVLRDHRHQVLRPEHIAAHVIGWGDKATAIETLAEQLNIGLDSMVFIDDSDYECALVAERLPQIEVRKTPQNPLEIGSLLESIESIDALEVSVDDRKRGAMYKAQAARSIAEQSSVSIGDFLRSLGLEIEISEVSDRSEIDRAAQLCQRTNQLNVTTRRHQVADIEAFVGDSDVAVRIVRLRDRYGDYGMCGLAIARFHDDICDVDTFLLSCRVIGRGVEDALGVDLERLAVARGSARLRGTFVPTAKNAPASRIFERLGFERTGDDDAIEYQKSLDGERRSYPDWFTVIS